MCGIRFLQLQTGSNNCVRKGSELSSLSSLHRKSFVQIELIHMSYLSTKM